MDSSKADKGAPSVELPPMTFSFEAMREAVAKALEWKESAEAAEAKVSALEAESNKRQALGEQFCDNLLKAEAENARLREERDELERWQDEALTALREREDLLPTFMGLSFDLGYAGHHYLKAACAIAIRCKAAESELSQLKAEMEGMRWREVQVELPEEREKVLVQYEYLPSILISSWFQWDGMQEPLWSPGFTEWGRVVRWAPIPKPPQPLKPEQVAESVMKEGE